jgi:hypothetical protein
LYELSKTYIRLATSFAEFPNKHLFFSQVEDGTQEKEKNKTKTKNLEVTVSREFF